MATDCRCVQCTQDKLMEVIKAHRREKGEDDSGPVQGFICGTEDSTIAPNMQTDWLLTKGWTWTPCGRRLQPPGGIKQDWRDNGN